MSIQAMSKLCRSCICPCREIITPLFHVPSTPIPFARLRSFHTDKSHDKQANWIIQRDMKVFTFKTSGQVDTLKELPVWLLKTHKFLMTNVVIPKAVRGHASCEPATIKLDSVDSLIAKAWSTPKRDVEAVAHGMIRKMDSMSVEQIILIADIFCLKKVWVPLYCRSMINFITEMSELLVFTPSQLARLAFHMLCQGGASPDFTFILEERTLELIHDFTLNDIAVICNSFFNCQTRIKSLKLLDEISLKLLKELDSLNFWYLSIFMKTFRYSNFIKVTFYHQFGDLLIEKDYLKQFNSLPQVMHIAFTYASLRITHPDLFSYILRTCVQSSGYKFRMKDVSKIIWSCGTLLIDKPNDLENIQQMVEIARTNISRHEVTEYPDNLVDLCIGLCFLNMYSDFFISMVFSPECLPSLLRLNVNRQRFYQLDFLHHCIQIEHPAYGGNVLDDETRRIISSEVGEFPLPREFALKKGLKEALVALQKLLGTKKVGFRRILPHYQSSDIIVVWDRLQSRFVKENRDPSDEADDRFVKLVVMVTSFMQTTYDGKPLGLHRTRIRQLGILGYRVVQVSPEEASRFVHGDLQESMALLHEKIMKEIKLCSSS